MSEERARAFIERLLIDIHWGGKRSDHPHDMRWLASHVKQLTPRVLPIISAALSCQEADDIARSVESRTKERIVAWLEESGYAARERLAAQIRALPLTCGEAEARGGER